jgi:hypothetical protein
MVKQAAAAHCSRSSSTTAMVLAVICSALTPNRSKVQPRDELDSSTGDRSGIQVFVTGPVMLPTATTAHGVDQEGHCTRLPLKGEGLTLDQSISRVITIEQNPADLTLHDGVQRASDAQCRHAWPSAALHCVGGFMDEDLATDAQFERQRRHPDPTRFRLVHSVDAPLWWWRQANFKAMPLQRRGQLLKIGRKSLKVHCPLRVERAYRLASALRRIDLCDRPAPSGSSAPATASLDG